MESLASHLRLLCALFFKGDTPFSQHASGLLPLLQPPLNNWLEQWWSGHYQALTGHELTT